MFIDAAHVADGDALHADLCVVGAGAAGIAIALQFVASPYQVVLVEGGGVTDDGTVGGIHKVVYGPPARLEREPSLTWRFGGNTNHWFGNCRPLDDDDFEPHEWVPFSGWPIRRHHLLPYFEQAQRLCGLGEFRAYEVEAIRRQPIGTDAAVLTPKIVQTCPVPSFDELFRQRLGEADNVRVCLDARALRLETTARGVAVRAVAGRSLGGGRFRVTARVFVLAAGGIENPRLLLCSTDGHANRLGNAHDLVGRFFMEHPFVDVPLGRSSRAFDLAFQHGRQPVGGTIMWSQLALAGPLMQRERLTGLSLWPTPAPAAGPPATALRAVAARPPRPGRLLRRMRHLLRDPAGVAARLWRRLARRGGAEADAPSLRFAFEDAPDRDNRVQLSSARDAFGQPAAALVYSRSDETIRRHARAAALAAQALGLDGRRLAEHVQRRFRDRRVNFFWHHMGTTRMHADPRYGVVDGDCRVHGVSNLFVAGSSVFPTSGTATPTLTIIALALRLAEHIRRGHAGRD